MAYNKVEEDSFDLAAHIFGSGRIFAHYNLETKQCTALLKIFVEESSDDSIVDISSTVNMAPPADGEGILEILNFMTDTAIYQENYVDPETNTLYRKPKVKLEYLADPGYDSVKGILQARPEPYKVRVSLIDYKGDPWDTPESFEMKVKDRGSLLSIRDPIILYREPMTIEVKATSPGKGSILRVKDKNYQLVPGLLSATIAPPSW